MLSQFHRWVACLNGWIEFENIFKIFSDHNPYLINWRWVLSLKLVKSAENLEFPCSASVAIICTCLFYIHPKTVSRWIFYNGMCQRYVYCEITGLKARTHKHGKAGIWREKIDANEILKQVGGLINRWKEIPLVPVYITRWLHFDKEASNFKEKYKNPKERPPLYFWLAAGYVNGVVGNQFICKTLQIVVKLNQCEKLTSNAADKTYFKPDDCQRKRRTQKAEMSSANQRLLKPR